MSGSTKKLLFGLAVGAAAGLVLGYLLSGKKPSDIAEDIGKAAEKLKNKFSEPSQTATDESAKTV